MIPCTHSGKRYTFTAATKIYRLEGRLTSVKWRGMEPGVWIEDIATGTKIWRNNSSYPHIEPLPFKDPTTHATYTKSN
jgi:hypothetical protein